MVMYPKQVTAGILCLLFAVVCLGQKTSLEQIENKDVSRYKTFTVEVETKKKYSVPASFKHIAVIDARADKSKL